MLFLVAPPHLALPQKWADDFRSAGLKYQMVESMDEILDQLDVIYLMTTMTPSYGKGQTDAVVRKTGDTTCVCHKPGEACTRQERPRLDAPSTACG